MHWSLFVLIGGAINALVNYGYKISSAKEGIYLMVALVTAVTSLTLFGFAFSSKTMKWGEITTGTTPLLIIGMGVGSALIMYLFINAFARGPLTLVDPLWACVYALGSAALGILILREMPSPMALGGIGLYLLGAFLMARG